MRITINFSPREHVYARLAYLALALCLFAAASVFAAGYGAYSRSEAKVKPLMEKVSMLEARSAELDGKLKEIKKTVVPAKAKADALQVAFVNDAIRQKAFSWTGFLNKVEALVPDGVGITALRPDFNTHFIEIAGNADSIGQALLFVDRLTKSPYFADIPPVFHTSEVVADKDVGKTIQQFSIRIEFFPEGRQGAQAAPAAAEDAGHGG